MGVSCCSVETEMVLCYKSVHQQSLKNAFLKPLYVTKNLVHGLLSGLA